MDTLRTFSAVVTVLAFSTLIGRLGISIVERRTVRRSVLRVVRVFELLIGATQILVMLAGVYLAFYDMASRVFLAERVLEVWEDERAVFADLAKWLILYAVTTLLVAISMLQQFTAWERCPYCGRFPVRREIDRASNSGKWLCRAFPRRHNGSTGIHRLSKPQRRQTTIMPIDNSSGGAV